MPCCSPPAAPQARPPGNAGRDPERLITRHRHGRDARRSTRTDTASSSPATSTTTTECRARPPARPASLELRFLGQQGATGHGELGFALRNTGSRRCHTYGYPGVQFLSSYRRAAADPVPAHHHDFFGSPRRRRSCSRPAPRLRSGSASPTATRPGRLHDRAGLQVIRPNDTATLHATISHGAYECGTATVSPMRPGTSAYRLRPVSAAASCAVARRAASSAPASSIAVIASAVTGREKWKPWTSRSRAG